MKIRQGDEVFWIGGETRWSSQDTLEREEVYEVQMVIDGDLIKLFDKRYYHPAEHFILKKEREIVYSSDFLFPAI